MKKLSGSAILLTLIAVITSPAAHAQSLDTLIATNGTVTQGTLVFSSFGANLLGGGLTAANVVVAGLTSAGGDGLRFTGPFFETTAGNARETVVDITFTVTVIGPTSLIHGVQQALAPNAVANGNAIIYSFTSIPAATGTTASLSSCVAGSGLPPGTPCSSRDSAVLNSGASTLTVDRQIQIMVGQKNGLLGSGDASTSFFDITFTELSSPTLTPTPLKSSTATPTPAPSFTAPPTGTPTAIAPSATPTPTPTQTPAGIVPSSTPATTLTPTPTQTLSAPQPFTPTPTPAPPLACPVDRPAVKAGSDSDAGLINLSSSTPTTIGDMRSWPAPSLIPPTKRISPYETTVWVLDTTLVGYQLEADSNYRLVLMDSSGNTLIARIVSPDCAAGSRFLDDIRAARARFDGRLSATTSARSTILPVRISGVGMFDVASGQAGAAPNGIELHPVLDLAFDTGRMQIRKAPGRPRKPRAVGGHG